MRSTWAGSFKDMSNAKRDTLEGLGSVGKTAIGGMKDRSTNS